MKRKQNIWNKYIVKPLEFIIVCVICFMVMFVLINVIKTLNNNSINKLVQDKGYTVEEATKLIKNSTY